LIWIIYILAKGRPGAHPRSVGPQPQLVLVAEDDDDVRDALVQVLETEGFQVMPAIDGRDALDRLGQVEPPCAIVLDWVMPRIGGESFLAARADSDRLSRIPVFVVSATHLIVSDNRVQGFLEKPFAVDDLLLLLRRVCGAHCPEERRAACANMAANRGPRVALAATRIGVEPEASLPPATKA